MNSRQSCFIRSDDKRNPTALPKQAEERILVSLAAALYFQLCKTPVREVPNSR